MKAPSTAWARPAAFVFALLAVASSVPHLRATLWPPPGARFVGVFYSIPDVYNYFSYMQQAEAGAFLFSNKLTLEPHRPALVNLEWWAVGFLSRVTGMGLPNAFRCLGLVAALVLVFGVDRWLTKAGLPGTHRLGALLLVFLGGGFGGVFFLVFGPPAWRFLDLTTGLFPFISILVNPHFVTGTALLVWALLGLCRGGKAAMAGILLGNILGLSRPYDLVLLGGTRVLCVALAEPRSRWLRALLPLAGLLPAVLINYAVLYGSPAFRMLSGFKYGIPNFGALGLALGPAIAVAAVGLPLTLRAAPPTRLYEVAFLSWAILALLAATVLAIPLPYLPQCAVNIGVPLFALASLGLARWPPRALMVTAALLSTTGFISMKLVMEDNPIWFAPKERIEVAIALRPLCRPGEIVMAPPEIGMYANAFSSCRAFVTHIVAPDSLVRQEEMTRFYLEAGGDERRALLDRRCVAHLVLPGGSEQPTGTLLSPEMGFRKTASAGSGPAGFVVYSREPPTGCDRLP